MTVKQNLPKVFYAETDAYLAAYKKEFAGAKKKGLTDETAADPMCSPLYLLISTWSLAESNALVWVWTVLQGNCMVRSINSDPLALHNFRQGQSETITAKYDSTKPDQEGKFVSEKNMYANPFNSKPCHCPLLALAVWWCIEQEHFKTLEKLFLGQGKDGSASSKYCEQFQQLLM